MTRENHPVADLFPMLADDELGELAADIKQRGQLQPIMLDAEGRILDGRNRLAACRLAGVEPRFEDYAGDDPDGYALAVNIARRHLSTGARAMIAAKAALLLGRGGQKAVAIETGISNLRISDAVVVLTWAPDLAPAIVAGAQPLSTAVEVARERKAEAEALKSKMDRLRAKAPDLAALVDEGRMDVDEATDVLDAREAKAREDMDEEKQREHQRSVERQQEIDNARGVAARIVGNVRADVATISLGVEYGEPLVTKKMLADLRAAIDVLEARL